MIYFLKYFWKSSIVETLREIPRGIVEYMFSKKKKLYRSSWKKLCKNTMRNYKKKVLNPSRFQEGSRGTFELKSRDSLFNAFFQK